MPVFSSTVTDTFPVVAPAGTITVKDVAVACETVALTPLNFTTLFAAVGLKFVPVITTVDPTMLDLGVKLATVGLTAVKSAGDVATLATPCTSTVIFPVVTPAGTFTVSDLADALVGAAANTPLNFTMFCAAVVLKFTPFIVTDTSSTPFPVVGLKLKITGAGVPDVTAKADVDVPV